MIRFVTEWNDAPGVKDQVLAATWARLEIKDEQGAESKWLSRLVRSASNSVDRGVYGSVLPLAEWIVENWWFLLYESCRVPDFAGGRRLAAQPQQRPWVQRHNLLAAREGNALPDLTIYRDGGKIAFRWVPDPAFDERTHPVRFIEEGTLLAEPSEVERALHQLVDGVIARLGDDSSDAAQRIRDDWAAVCASRHDEQSLCAWAASLGIDPYDPRQLTEELIDEMQSRLVSVQAELRQDLLEATNAEMFVVDLNWLDRALLHLRVDDEISSPRVTNGIWAHVHGYQRACEVRQRYSLPIGAIHDLAAVLHESCDWPNPDRQVEHEEGTDNVSALVAMEGGHPRVIGPNLGHWAERFRLARSLYFVTDGLAAISPRLVTRACTWDQRASRAFAAELLAPAEALRERLGSVVSVEDLERIAREYDVRPTLIEHQVRNHNLALVDED